MRGNHGKPNLPRWIRRGAFGMAVALPLLAASLGPLRSDIVGGSSPASFSMCAEALDGAGLPRDECRAADIRFEIDPAGPVNPDDSDFGFSVDAGNLNGDDYTDIVVGDPRRNRVYIFFGRPSAASAYGLDPLDLADRQVSAESQADLILYRDPAIANQVVSFGWSVAISDEPVAAPCPPNDVASALLIGAPGEPGTTPNAPGTVFHLPAGSLCMAPVDPAGPPATIDPGTIGQAFSSPFAAQDDEFGYSVGFARVLNNTGTDPDLVVGARNALGGDGRVVFLPASGGSVDLTPGVHVRVEGLAGDGLGEVLASGDLDLDFDPVTAPFGDRDDVAIGAVGAANGKVVLVRGPLSPTGGMGMNGMYQEGVDAEILPIDGEEPGDYFGFSVDIGGQGRLAAGAVFADNSPPATGGNGLTNVPTGDRINGGKAYIWEPGILNSIGTGTDATSADHVLVARRSGDHLGFAVAFLNLDNLGGEDFIATARREDGSGLTIDEIDQGTAYVSYDTATLSSPLDLNNCAANSDCTGVGGIDVMLFGGDRGAGLGDEIGFVTAGGDWNGDGVEDLLLSSLTRKRVYLTTMDDVDNDLPVEGRNIRDDDDDGDGDSDSTDCAPQDPAINSSATEIPCNGIDENCNGLADDAPDADGDGFDACGATSVLDCDDDDPDSFPGAPELCDGNDNACLGNVNPIEFDSDGDGYVECTGWTDVQGDDPLILGGDDCDDVTDFTFPGAAPNDDPAACLRDRDDDDWGDEFPPTGITPGTDCGDLDPLVFPGAAQTENPAACMKDTDDDGWGDVAVPPEFDAGTDCDDLDPVSFPGAPELCDGNDNACAGMTPIDEVDDDGDTYVECSGWNDVQGDDPLVVDGGDCDDTSGTAADAFPGAAPLDNVPTACMKDSDGDDWGDQNPPAGVTPGFDCDDASITTFRGAAPNDDPTMTQCMKDDDGDDWGDSSPPGLAIPGTDCDDADVDIFPGAVEIEDDGIDQDCNGSDTVTCFTDTDGDGFGTLPSFLEADGDCTDPGQSALDTDCDDANPAIFPGAVEIEDDGIDQDCNGFDTITCVVDGDMDGAGTTAGTPVLADDGSCDAAQQESATSDDCDDADPNTFPGAPELCDGNDNACDGTIPVDETDVDGDTWVGCAGWNDTQGDDAGISGGGDCDETTGTAADTFPGAAPLDNVPTACMKDSDGDDYGDSTPPPGVTFGGDCDDSSAITFPGAAQTEAPLTCMRDFDDDGWGDAAPPAGVPAGTDCDDADPNSFPGAPELCDGNDNACGGSVPLDEIDDDGDTWVECAGWNDLQGDDPLITDGGDCDDTSGTAADTFPGAAPLDNVPTACMKDSDGDDWGDLLPPAGVVPGFDCNDASIGTFPGAAQNESATACMKDDDDDGYGDSSVSQPVVGGTDCDDIDPLEFPGQSWYADCDGDGAFRGAPVLACDVAAADALTPCLDSLPPDGGWTNTDPGPGADADDEDPGAQSGPPPETQVAGIMVTTDGVSWQLTGGSGPVNVYRGDLETLRSAGLYTQAPDARTGAERSCGEAGSAMADGFMPEPGRVVFYLVTARYATGESSLGNDSSGAVRPNANPCP